MDRQSKQELLQKTLEIWRRLMSKTQKNIKQQKEKTEKKATVTKIEGGKLSNVLRKLPPDIVAHFI